MSRMRCQLVEMNAVGAGKSVLSTAECVGLCRHPGLNQGPLDLQSNALPTELFRQTESVALFVIIVICKITIILRCR